MYLWFKCQKSFSMGIDQKKWLLLGISQSHFCSKRAFDTRTINIRLQKRSIRTVVCRWRNCKMAVEEDLKATFQEIEELTEEGFFGDKAKNLELLRKTMDGKEYLYKGLDEWLNDRKPKNKNIVAGYMIVFLQLYIDAIKTNNQESFDVIGSVFIGTSNYPQLECTSAFYEYIRIHTETLQLFSKAKQYKRTTLAQKKKLASALTNEYAKGIEVFSKILSRLVALLDIINGKPYDILSLSNKLLDTKITMFLNLSNGKYDSLVNKIDRDLRNAESHLDIYYNSLKKTFLIKKTNREITIEDMMEKIFPVIGQLFQAFLFSAIIIFTFFNRTDKERLCSIIERIVELEKNYTRDGSK